MTTANLEILNEYDADKQNNFDFFADVLGLWATQYVPEISCRVAQHADELFDVQAVRILLGKWHDAYKGDRKWQRECFKDIAVNNSDDVIPDSFNSYYKSELNAYNTALYALIVQ